MVSQSGGGGGGGGGTKTYDCHTAFSTSDLPLAELLRQLSWLGRDTQGGNAKARLGQGKAMLRQGKAGNYVFAV